MEQDRILGSSRVECGWMELGRKYAEDATVCRHNSNDAIMVMGVPCEGKLSYFLAA